MEDLLMKIGLSREAVPLVTSYLVRIASVIAILLGALFVSGLVKSWVERGLARIKFDATLTKFFATLTRWFILLIAVLGCLELFGIKTTSLAAVIGGASLAIGLAFQGSLSNVAAGIMLLVFRPFSVGQVIEAAGQLGVVEEVGLFTTHMNTFDKRHVIIPNGQIFGATIVNFSRNPIRRADVSVGVDYSADIDETREVLERAAMSVPQRLEEPPHVVFLSGLGASSVDWQVRVFCNSADFGDTLEALTRAIKVELDAAGIGIPYPQIVVHGTHEGPLLVRHKADDGADGDGGGDGGGDALITE